MNHRWQLMLLALMISPLVAAENPDTILSIEQPVMEAVEALDSPVVSRPLVHTHGTITSSPPDMSATRDAIYRPLGKNLWGISSAITAKKIPTISVTILSLCGLVELASASGARSEQNSTLAIPLGGLFVPFGIRTTTDMTSGSRALRFDVQSGSSEICSPDEGATFSFEVQSESTRKLKGSGLWNWSRDRKTTETTAWSCTAGQRERHTELPAFAWNDVIPVNCTGTHSSSADPLLKTPTYSQWFYLPESAVYIQREAGTDAFKGKHDFELIELGDENSGP